MNHSHFLYYTLLHSSITKNLFLHCSIEHITHINTINTISTWRCSTRGEALVEPYHSLPKNKEARLEQTAYALCLS